MSILKIILYVIFIPPLLFIILFIIALFLPSSPNEPIDMVFKKACGSKLPVRAVIIKREPIQSFLPQGFNYSESGTIQVSSEQATAILAELEGNPEYRLDYEYNTYERFVVGDTLGICNVSKFSGYIDYQYTVW